jgi:hypothetical protein
MLAYTKYSTYNCNLLNLYVLFNLHKNLKHCGMQMCIQIESEWLWKERTHSKPVALNEKIHRIGEQRKYVMCRRL